MRERQATGEEGQVRDRRRRQGNIHCLQAKAAQKGSKECGARIVRCAQLRLHGGLRRIVWFQQLRVVLSVDPAQNGNALRAQQIRPAPARGSGADATSTWAWLRRGLGVDLADLADAAFDDGHRIRSWLSVRTTAIHRPRPCDAQRTLRQGHGQTTRRIRRDECRGAATAEASPTYRFGVPRQWPHEVRWRWIQVEADGCPGDRRSTPPANTVSQSSRSDAAEAKATFTDSRR